MFGSWFSFFEFECSLSSGGPCWRGVKSGFVKGPPPFLLAFVHPLVIPEAPLHLLSLF